MFLVRIPWRRKLDFLFSTCVDALIRCSNALVIIQSVTPARSRILGNPWSRLALLCWIFFRREHIEQHTRKLSGMIFTYLLLLNNFLKFYRLFDKIDMLNKYEYYLRYYINIILTYQKVQKTRRYGPKLLVWRARRGVEGCETRSAIKRC